MLFAIALAFFILCIVLHELAHWYEMERHGLRVVEAGLGLPIPFLTLKVKIMRRGQPVMLKFSPLLIAAYVKGDGEKDGLADKPYRTVADIAGAGPIAHFVIVSVLLATLPFFGEVNAAAFGRSAACLLMGAAIWRWRSLLSAYVLPIIGLASMALLVWVLSKDPGALVETKNGGPVAIGRMVHSFSDDLLRTIMLAISMNLGLGMLNAMPLGPTDGGTIFTTAIKPRFPRFSLAFSIIGTVLILGLVGLALVNDVRSFF